MSGFEWAHLKSCRRYKGMVIERIGISYYCWLDFVLLHWVQPRCETLAAAKATITAAVHR